MPFCPAAEEDFMSHGRLLVLALIGVLPGVARAQFTTFIPPQPKAVDSVKAVVASQAKAQTDSVVNMQLTNMKTWVDSAAGIAPLPPTAPDTVATTAAPVPVTPGAAPVMHNGRRAPATASSLPLIALIGAITLGLGMFLLSSPEPARHRA
jgi:hypothetical protein